MSKVLVEFINTWSGCDAHVKTVEVAAAKYKDQVETKIYYVGKDFEDIKKYGIILKGTMIINEQKKIDKINKKVIESAIQEAVNEL